MMTEKKYQEEKSKTVHKISENKAVIINTHVGYQQSFCENNNINNLEFNCLQMIMSAKPESISSLSRLLHKSRRSVGRYLGSLSSSGLIEVDQVAAGFRYMGSKIKTNLVFHTPAKRHDYENPERQRKELGSMFTEIPTGDLSGQLFTPILHMGTDAQQIGKVTLTNNNNELPNPNCIKNKQRVPEAREKNCPTPKRRVIKKKNISRIRKGLDILIPYASKWAINGWKGIRDLANQLFDRYGFDVIYNYLRFFYEQKGVFPPGKHTIESLFNSICGAIDSVGASMYINCEGFL